MTLTQKRFAENLENCYRRHESYKKNIGGQKNEKENHMVGAVFCCV